MDHLVRAGSAWLLTHLWLLYIVFGLWVVALLAWTVLLLYAYPVARRRERLARDRERLAFEAQKAAERATIFHLEAADRASRTERALEALILRGRWFGRPQGGS